MSNFHDAVAKAINAMAMLGTEKEKQNLMNNARQHTIDEWRAKSIGKVCAVGGLTGLLGGPAGLLLEAGDTAYVLPQADKLVMELVIFCIKMLTMKKIWP